MTITAYSDLDAQLNGSKLMKKEDGLAYICTPDGGTTALPSTDLACALPVGSIITLTQTVASLLMQAVIPVNAPQNVGDGHRRQKVELVTHTGITTVTTILAGLGTFRTNYNTPA